MIPKEAVIPIYNVILGIVSLGQMGTILNFAEETITIYHVMLPMRPHDNFLDLKALNYRYWGNLEPNSTQNATKCAEDILDAVYEEVDIASYISKTCKHLTNRQQQQLIKLLLEYEILFNRTLGDWHTKPVGMKLKPGAKAYHGRPFPIPHVHLKVLKREVKRLVELGVLIKQPDSEWGSPTFIIPKKNKKVRCLTNY
jgi:hypothetical protein